MIDAHRTRMFASERAGKTPVILDVSTDMHTYPDLHFLAVDRMDISAKKRNSPFLLVLSELRAETISGLAGDASGKVFQPDEDAPVITLIDSFIK